MNERRHPTWFRVVSLTLIPLLLGACASWQAQDPPFAPHVEKGPEVVRLTLVDGRVLDLRRPTLSGDSIVGKNLRARSSSAIAAVPIGDVAQMEVSKVTAKKTMLAVGLPIAGLALIAGVGGLIVLATW